MADKPIIIDGIDVSGCCQYMPRYMEDYDIDTLDYCRYHFKPCKDVDVKYCYYKQLNNVCSIGLWQRDYSRLEEFCKMSCDCKSNPNCYFKQLARAKKENEELRNKLNSNIERMNQQNEKLHNE